MTIKIKFPQQELKRRAAKILNCTVNRIDSVHATEGGRKFFVAVSEYSMIKGDHIKTAILTIWQIVDALPLTDISGSVESFWDKGYDTVLSILGLSQMPQSENEIKKAYYKLAKIYHPDVGGDPDKFREINFAYETLICSLPELREK